MKSSLQRLIQLLKYHRNKKYTDEIKFSPRSIIITTLAAYLYGQEFIHSNEPSLIDALLAIPQKMLNYIKAMSYPYELVNPELAEENYLDKWNMNEEYKKEFIKWIESFIMDTHKLLDMKDSNINSKMMLIEENYGVSVNFENLKISIRDSMERILKESGYTDTKQYNQHNNNLETKSGIMIVVPALKNILKEESYGHQKISYKYAEMNSQYMLDIKNAYENPEQHGMFYWGANIPEENKVLIYYKYVASNSMEYEYNMISDKLTFLPNTTISILNE